MTFALPIGLLALLTLPIIIILHLLRERRRRVVVPSLQHWQNLPRSRAAERVRRLPLTLLLLLHLLVAALAGLALGRPQWAGAIGNARQLALVIDTTTSMAAREGGETRLDLARERAQDLLRGLGSGDRVTLIAAGPQARVLASGDAADAAGMSAALAALQPGGTGADLAGALTLAQAAFEGPRRRAIVVLTDGGPPAGAALPASVAADLDWQQLGAGQPNHAIVALAARPWGGNLQVYARIANYGPSEFATSVRLFGDDQLLGSRIAGVAPNGATELTWTLPVRYTLLRAAIESRDGLPQDDEARLNLALTRPTEVLLVSEAPDLLRRALAAVPGVEVSALTPDEYSPGANPEAALTVLEGFLPDAWPAGAVLAIAPPANHPLLAAGDAADAALAGVGWSRDLLAGLSLGSVEFGGVQPLIPPAWAAPALSRDGAVLIARGRTGGRAITIWNFRPAQGNLATRLAFPLLVARTVRDLTPPALPQSLPSGTPFELRPDARATEVSLTAPGGERTTLPAAPLLALGQLSAPGLYAVEERAGGATLFSGQLPVNAGAALESDLRPQPAPAIAGGAPPADEAPQRRAYELWPWLALLALALLVFEWGYLHRS